MAPIIPAGGRKMDWVRDPEAVEKQAQDMFSDDPQLDAIKDLPCMQDGINELQNMTNNEIVPMETGAVPGGAVDQAIEKVKDAAQEVADAAVKDVEKAVTDAVKNVGKTEATPVADTVDEIVPEKEEVEIEVEEVDEVPGVVGDADGIEKEGDKDEDDKDEKKEDDKDDKDDKDDDKEENSFFASGKGMRRIAELSNDELKDLRHYWKDLLGFPPEYVDAMLKKYKA